MTIEEKITGILEGACLTFFGYTPFETATTLIAEALNP